ncbi:Gfo/Idh/MocA family protein [Petrimonas sp.]|uniref:Gfo/Idh/MocA family protein n=1 Tax=Petrimonas sp. TaxID=2023866 RepID=UPI003F51466C
MIHWGFIGCGNVTEKKSGPAFGKVKGSGVAAVMRRNAELAKDYAMRHNINKWYSDAHALINDNDVTAVYVSTPPGSHAEYAIAAMKAGKPVYVEKPMAASYEECVAMSEVANETGVPCFVAYYRRTLPYFLRVKQLLESREIGEPGEVKIRFIIPPYSSDLSWETLPWRVKKEVAGAGYFYDLASHQLDYLDFIFGEITEVSGTAKNVAGLYDVEDTVDGEWLHKSGVRGSGHWEFAAPVKERTDEIEIIGSRGSIRFSTFHFTPIVLNNASGEKVYTEENPENIQFYLIQSIVNYLNGNGDYPISDFRSAMRTNWVMDKMLG